MEFKVLMFLFHHNLISSNPFQACCFKSNSTMIHTSVQFFLEIEYILNQEEIKRAESFNEAGLCQTWS